MPKLKRITGLLCALMLSVGLLAGCTTTTTQTPSTSDTSVQGPVPVETQADEQTVEPQDKPVSADYGWTEWDESQYPNYVRDAGKAVVTHPELEPGDVMYTNLDKLGRAGAVYANIDYSLYRAGLERERGDISDIYPSGWTDNDETTIPMPNGRDYHGWFYNRSHLLAKSLGGHDEADNLITGTRPQNVGANDGKGGMAYTETLVRNWFENNPDGTVYYAATPVYEGNELVARSVFVDVKSSDGSIDMHVEVYNAAKGHTIDYSTGAWK